MTTSREMVLIGGVVKALKDRGSWTGETHIQKAAYIAKVRRNIPFESEFVLYKHGPFSFDMSKSIVHMLSRGLLYTENNPGYGPSFRVSDSLWKALNTRLDSFYSQFEAGIYSVSSALARKNVAELERVATAVYVMSNFSNFSLEEQAKTITKLKPHIAQEMALGALREAELIR
ncbi:hypothetical protein [Mesorhizobium sp.]|uniref:hypothetical protein n=1 Tax=Mesorhizobium sp. TaxID=1871066 RepID=UPI000FE954BB|nr:hypothetical protein [Mesorhizobium sp.]RWO58547.1 MAG: hypothetical protein EOS14_17610 [Mesorhizobium sp.]